MGHQNPAADRACTDNAITSNPKKNPKLEDQARAGERELIAKFRKDAWKKA